MTKRKEPTLAQVKKKLRDGECTTVVVKGQEKALCKLGGKVRVSNAPA